MINSNNLQVGASSSAPAVFKWNYEENARLVDERRHQQFLEKKAHYDAIHKNAKLIPPASVRTALQLELFNTVPDNYNFVEKLLSNLPRQRQREYFRKLYLKTYKGVKDDGSIAYQLGNLQRRAANIFLYDLLNNRIKKVFNAYKVNVSFLLAFSNDMPRWYEDLETEIRNETLHSKQPIEPLNLELLANRYKRYTKNETVKSKLPFYLIGKSKLETLAQSIAVAFEQELIEFMYKLAPRAEELGMEGVKSEFLKLYEKCGVVCQEIGFEIPHWSSKRKKLKGEQLDSALRKVACPKHWLRIMLRTQKRMVEHVAIACGEVRKQVSNYISNSAFREWQTQQRNNLDYLKTMILVNVEDPEEQVELFEAYIGSPSYVAIRRNEMMCQLRGIEEWAEREEHEALFLTLTSPSSFHATHSTGNFNNKWNGASPRDTHNYLNKVWQQFRALLAKRKMKMYGMRVAEPHHDATTHWHLLVYVKAEHKCEVIRLFKQKALEIDGNESGAKEHRCKVEECDKSKGSATAYIAKYISKNIDGFANDSEMSDENPNLSLKDNARRVRAWASLWGIRQFQFFGGASIGVWRELRRLVAGQVDDEIIEKARACADVSCYASYLDVQSGAMAQRADQPIKLHYITTEENKYGETRQQIKGVKNQFNLTTIITRLKKWTIQKRQAERSDVQESAHCAPWTCVSNCNRSEIEQKIKNAVAPICLPLHQRQIDYLISGKPLLLNERNKIQVINNEIVITNPLKEYEPRKSHIDRLREIPIFFN
ncbi:replication endonuclease [Pasteurella multocida]